MPLRLLAVLLLLSSISFDIATRRYDLAIGMSLAICIYFYRSSMATYRIEQSQSNQNYAKKR